MSLRCRSVEHRDPFARGWQAQRHHEIEAVVGAALEEIDHPSFRWVIGRPRHEPGRRLRHPCWHETARRCAGARSLRAVQASSAWPHFDGAVGAVGDAELAPLSDAASVATDRLAVTDHALRVFADPVRLDAECGPQHRRTHGCDAGE